MFPELAPRSPVMPVSELVRHARQLLEQNLPLTWIGGEISNFTRAASGHWYFSLKDASAQVRCVMFRNKNQYLDWPPENGAQVEVRALATLYEARGEFQLSVETMRRAGLGALYEAFEKRKAKLAKEGLFDAAHKRPLPGHPRQIGVVTSPAAAALRDVLTTLARRMPSIPVILYPTPVQGEGSAEKIAAALRTASQRAECDVLILCRGGGSIEDLWAFNEESVARAVYDSGIPVVCGVGHETDFSIADFVADQRAPTPTAAAELVAPDRLSLLHRAAGLATRLDRLLLRGLEQRAQQLDYLSRRLVHPGEKLRNQATHLAHLRGRLGQACGRTLDNQAWRLAALSRRLPTAQPDFGQRRGALVSLQQRASRALAHRMEIHAATLARMAAHLEHLNPATALKRGFSIVQKTGGEIVTDSRQVAPDEPLRITFAQGSAGVTVKDVA